MSRTPFFRQMSVALLCLAMNQAVAKAVERPLIPLLKAEEIGPFCERSLADLRKMVTAMENLPKPRAGDAQKVFADWNRLHIALEDLAGPVAVWTNMSPDPKVRANSEACSVEASKFETDLFQSEKLHARFKAVKPGDAVERKLWQDVMEGFEDTGVALPPEKRARMKALLTKLEEMRQEFARNVRDNETKLTFTPDELKGLPASYLAKARRDDKGNYLLGFDYPEYQPFMQYADNGDARRRYQIAFVNRGTPRNLELLKEAMNLRHEMAQLFDLPSYAHHAIRRRMALKPEAVHKFLGEVQAVVTGLEKKELEELREFKAQTLKQPLADTRIERWDVSYWQEKLKQARYSIDQNELRKYFPTDAAVAWAFHVSGNLYGTRFQRINVPTWHQEVQYYDVYDIDSNKRIGGIYLDLFPRAGKYGHPAAFAMRGVSTLAKRAPISVLVANFDRTGLDSNELETLVHEFGHILHGVLSSTRYVTHAGTSVERDFVEAPSQMYEEWARRKESLTLLSKFCKTPCPTVDDALLQRMTAAHNFGRGVRYARQLMYASFDMSIHGEQLADPLAVWARMEGDSPLGYVPGTEFPGQFNHVMGGYSAGYYSYMWSEVLALDMLSRYNEKLMDAQTGRMYRKAILSRGGELRGREMVRNFLGREPNSKAFFDEISGQRLH